MSLVDTNLDIQELREASPALKEILDKAEAEAGKK